MSLSLTLNAKQLKRLSQGHQPIICSPYHIRATKIKRDAAFVCLAVRARKLGHRKDLKAIQFSYNTPSDIFNLISLFGARFYFY
jgi:hypothetical protein